MDSTKRLILTKIFKSNDWVDTYQFHTEYFLSPASILRSCFELEEEKILSREGHLIKITNYGQTWILKNRISLFHNVNRYWAEPTPWKLTEPTTLDSPYLPKLNLIDKKYFLNILHNADLSAKDK